MSYDMRDDIIYDGTTENWPVTVSYSHIPQETWNKIFGKPTRTDEVEPEDHTLENFMGRCR